MLYNYKFRTIIVLLLIFSVSNIYAIRLRRRRNLKYGNNPSGSDSILVVSPSDSNSAKFRARRGTPHEPITVSILESSITMITGSGLNANQQILVDTFTIDAPATLNGNGRATIYVGATAHIKSTNVQGDYSGTATVKVVENNTGDTATKTFTLSITLLAPLSVVKNRDLVFPTSLAGSTFDVTVAKNDSTAANFTVHGEANASIKVSIASSSIDMTDGHTNILVDSFTGTGNKTLNSSGEKTFGIGATAHVTNTNSDGYYTATQVLSVIYR